MMVLLLSDTKELFYMKSTQKDDSWSILND